MDRSAASRTPLHALAHTAGRIAARLFSPPWLEIATFLLVGSAYLYNAWRFTYPAGYAGLYTLMADLLAHEPFPLPMQVPYYGPGGIPFAYPPVAAYLTAFFIGPLQIPVFAYLRWEPAVVCILVMLGAYLFGRQLTGDRIKALVGTAVVFSAEIMYSYHGTASGSVRSVALLWTVLGAYVALLAYTHARRWLAYALLAGMFMALTLMTHLSYAAFLAPGLALMAFLTPDGGPWRARIRTMVVIALAGVVLSAPWWGTMVVRYGSVVFLNAGATHGTLGLLEQSGLNPLALTRSLLRWYANLGGTWWPAFLAGLILAGFTYSLARRRWLLPVWMVVTVATLGQTDRFEILLGGLLAGEVLVDVARFAGSGVRGRMLVNQETLGGLAFLALTLVPVMFLGFRGIQWTEVALTDDLVEMGAWVKANSPERSQYLYLGSDHDVAEWLPYLVRRTPGIAPWGAEWTGNYDAQNILWGELSGCIGALERGCLDEFLPSLQGEITSLIVPGEPAGLVSAISNDKTWLQVFHNAGFSVYAREG
jgi:hypothetical protein